MRFRKGFKIQIAEDEVLQTPFKPTNDIVTHYIELTTEGVLTIKDAFACDGCSGPTITTKKVRRG